jgi:hypothetical protein
MGEHTLAGLWAHFADWDALFADTGLTHRAFLKLLDNAPVKSKSLVVPSLVKERPCSPLIGQGKPSVISDLTDLTEIIFNMSIRNFEGGGRPSAF